jgi:IMP dehydrogenase
MASARAVSDRVAGQDPYERARKGFFREGISTARVYLEEGRASVGEILIEVVSGLQSAFTYVGATRCEQFQEKAVVGVQTAGGFYEGTPHGGQ